MRVLFFDLETTGFDKRWDYVIEVAGILYDTKTGEEIDRFHEYIKPWNEYTDSNGDTQIAGKKIPEFITELTGITNYQVRSCRSEDAVLRDFVEFVMLNKPDVLCAHNGDKFDVPFIMAKSEFYFLDMPHIRTIDTLKMARSLKPPVKQKTATGRPSYKQISLAEYYGVAYEAHSAIEDVRALIQIYNKMSEEEKPSISTKRKRLGF